MVELGPPEIVVLALAGLLAGAINAVAGGGSLVSFPALLAVGYPSIAANVTNIVAVLPGYLGGSVAYRRELAGQGLRALALSASSVAGGLSGALLLELSSERLFETIVSGQQRARERRRCGGRHRRRAAPPASTTGSSA